MKVKIRIPQTLSDIKLSQYQKFLRVTKDVEDEATIHKRMVAVFCDLEDSIVNAMTRQSFDSVLATLVKILSFDSEMELIRRFKFDGVDYGFIPNMDELTVGELADLDNYIIDWQKMHLAMGVMYRPVKNKVRDTYLIEDYKVGVELDVPLDVALSSYFFFQNLLKDLLSCIPNYIKGVVMQNQKSKSLVENGVGIKAFTDSLEVTCSALKKYMV